MAKALDQTAFHQTKLLKACVRSVVYNLKKDLEKLDDVLYWEEEDAGCCGRAFSETEERVTQAQRQLWYSVQRMKWLQGDGISVAWIRVKQGRIFFWVRIDDPEHLRLLHLWLPSECMKRHLKLSKEWMHMYESVGSGMDFPYVFKHGKSLSDTPTKLRGNGIAVSAQRGMQHRHMQQVCNSCRIYTRWYTHGCILPTLLSAIRIRQAIRGIDHLRPL